ncbi:MAG: acyl-CoA thioesterase [Erythrobacter sp.]
MTAAFPTLERRDAARFAIAITPDLAVGPPGHAYLFGGATLALALEVAAAATGRPVVQGALQFVSFTPLGAVLELTVETLQAGRTLAQVRVTGSLEGRILFHAGVVLGQREGFVPQQWVAAPVVPLPEACPPCTDLPPQDANAHFLASIEAREAGDAAVTPGRTLLWLRRRDGAAIDVAGLALFADFVPLALGRTSGQTGGGNSLDNALRMVRTAPAGWCLADMTISAAHGGFAQGTVNLWDQSGSLLATGSQSLLMKG